jgi:hypothetical protein
MCHFLTIEIILVYYISIVIVGVQALNILCLSLLEFIKLITKIIYLSLDIPGILQINCYTVGGQALNMLCFSNLLVSW